MEIIEYGTPSAPIDIFFLGDTHEGNANQATDELKQAVSIIKNNPTKHTKVIGMGDYIDAINHMDKRFNPVEICEKYKIKDLKNLPVKQVDYFVKSIEPIKDKFIAIVTGNHEEKYSKYNGFDPMHYLSERLGGVGLIGYNGFVRLSILKANPEKQKNPERMTFDIALTHGHGGGGYLEGYPINQVYATFRYTEADIFIMGHIHQMVCDSSTVISPYGSKLSRRRKFYGSNGCFLFKEKIGTRGYFEGHKGKPASIGMLKLSICPDHSKQDSVISLTPIFIV